MCVLLSRCDFVLGRWREEVGCMCVGVGVILFLYIIWFIQGRRKGKNVEG